MLLDAFKCASNNSFQRNKVTKLAILAAHHGLDSYFWTKRKIRVSLKCRFDEGRQVLILRKSDGLEIALHPAFVRRNDTSAASINEWTGEKIAPGGLVSEQIAPAQIQAVGNYAVLIMWEDGFNQVRLNFCKVLKV